MSLIYRVDATSDQWKEFKSRMIGEPVDAYPMLFKQAGYGQFTTIRRIGGDWLPIIDDDDWRATGTMEEHLHDELDKGISHVLSAEDEFVAEIEVDVSTLEDEYPVMVDDKLMVASNGKIGLIRLLEWQEKEIFEMLVYETGNLSKELGGGE